MIELAVYTEIVRWLDEEDGGLANHDLFLVVHRVWERLQKRGADEGEVACAMRLLAPLEFMAHGKKPHVWGSIFSPKREADPANGVDEYPKLADFGVNDVEGWAELSTVLSRPQLRARFADAVWEIGRKITRPSNSHRFGLLAAEAYLQSASECLSGALYESLQFATRSFRLAVQLGAKEHSERAFEFLMGAADSAKLEHIGIWMAPFDRLIRDRGLESGRHARVIAALERRFQDTLRQPDVHRLRMVGAALALYFHARRDYVREKQLTLAYGEAIAKLTENMTSMLAVHHLSSVVEDYSRVGLRQDANRVRVLLEERGRGAGAEMKEHAVEVKLELDEVEHSIAEKLDHKDPYLALWRLAWSCTPRLSETIERFKQASEGLIFHQLLPVSLIGGDGLPVATIGTYDQDPEGRHVMEYTRELHLNASFFMFGTDAWKKKFDMPDFSSVEGLFDCLLIPEDRRSLFQEGFAAYANGDYVKAIHVLIPQVENSLRKLLELLDLPITKTDDDGGFELKNMNDVLHDETVQATLDERLWTFLKVLYTDKRGLNLRNVVSHGIAEASEFNKANAALVLQSVMLLTMVREKGIFFETSAESESGTQAV